MSGLPDFSKVKPPLEDGEIKEALRLYEWALKYEQRGLHIAADVLRDEGHKAIERYISRCFETLDGEPPCPIRLIENPFCF